MEVYQVLNTIPVMALGTIRNHIWVLGPPAYGLIFFSVRKYIDTPVVASGRPVWHARLCAQ